MRVAHSAQAVVKERLVNQREFTRTAEAGAWNEDPLVSVGLGCNSGELTTRNVASTAEKRPD
jgi:hypothetical protein